MNRSVWVEDKMISCAAMVLAGLSIKKMKNTLNMD